jgi:hypothetical protein
MNNVINQSAFLPSSRNFPRELNQLTIELDKSYIDIANNVNNRTISVFPVDFPAFNGESWFLTSRRQQGFRQVYSITSYAAFNHNINFNNLTTFTRIYGIIFNGTNYYPMPFVTNTLTDMVGLSVTPTQVVITSGATSPVIQSGIIILEWISNV